MANTDRYCNAVRFRLREREVTVNIEIVGQSIPLPDQTLELAEEERSAWWHEDEINENEQMQSPRSEPSVQVVH